MRSFEHRRRRVTSKGGHLRFLFLHDCANARTIHGVKDKFFMEQDNAQRFVSKLKRRSASENSFKFPLRYTVLGLGDQNYTAFMAVPRLVRRKLEELGAKEFYKYKEVDEVEGIEEQVEPWIESLWKALDGAFKLPEAPSNVNSCKSFFQRGIVSLV